MTSSSARRADLLLISLTGGLIGFSGAGLAHASTVACSRLGSQEWLRGPFGPAFFDLALFTGIFYGAIGIAAGRRTATAAVGFFVSFLTLLIPLFVLTRYGGWERDPLRSSANQWTYAVMIVYTASIWAAITAIGAAAATGSRWRGAFAAIFGSLSAYAALSVAQKLAAPLLVVAQHPNSLWPAPLNLLDGFFSGAGVCFALKIASGKTSGGRKAAVAANV